jgi:hypothetical protein
LSIFETLKCTVSKATKKLLKHLATSKYGRFIEFDRKKDKEYEFNICPVPVARTKGGF